jgi:hypothetical protein
MQKYKWNQKFLVTKELKIERRSIKRINAQRPAFSRDSRNHDRDIACSGPSDRSTARNNQPQVRRGRSWDRPSSISQYGKTNDSERCRASERSRHGVKRSRPGHSSRKCWDSHPHHHGNICRDRSSGY